MRQRVMIAMALSCYPELLIADEPTTVLDILIQAQVLNLLSALKNEFSLTYLFIAHGFNVVKHISGRVGVMCLGKLMEIAEKNELYDHLLNPYTQVLLSAIPVTDTKSKKQKILLKGDVPNPIDPPERCRFSERCFRVMYVCRRKSPGLLDAEEDHGGDCHLFE